MGEDQQVAFHDLPETAFPLIIWYRDAETREVIRKDVLPGPGAHRIASFAPRRVVVTIKYGDGAWSDSFEDGDVWLIRKSGAS